jgi:hypothetical protein
MPEPYWPKHKSAYTLADADRNRETLSVKCLRCGKVGYYLPVDMKEIFGDIPLDDLQIRMRCERCGLDGQIDIRKMAPSIAELQNMTIRRLDRIRWVRRVTWREVKGA